MFGALAMLESLFKPPSTTPAIAAAITVLNNTRPPPAPCLPGLDAALHAVAPHLSSAERTTWVAAMTGPLVKAGITTPHRLAAFLGQCSEESGGFRDLEEDLNYSATRLCQVWPNRFPTPEAAQPCAMQPEALANQVYANRMGNGNEASGDGWMFRGRGLIQITGRCAYEQFAKASGLSLDQAVATAASPVGAAQSAVWFWTANNLNALSDAWSIDPLTGKINGSLEGAAERTRLCSAALQVLGA